MNAPPSRLLLLLQNLGPRAPMIRRDLPGWYPGALLPALRTTLKTLEDPGTTSTDLDLAANRLAEVLRRRPETEEVARALEFAPGGPDGREMNPTNRLPETLVPPDRLRSECEALLYKVLEALGEQEGRKAAPARAAFPPGEVRALTADEGRQIEDHDWCLSRPDFLQQYAGQVAAVCREQVWGHGADHEAAARSVEMALGAHAGEKGVPAPDEVVYVVVPALIPAPRVPAY